MRASSVFDAETVNDDLRTPVRALLRSPIPLYLRKTKAGAICQCRCCAETCMTLGMLDRNQSDRLAKAGPDYYNHNIDTSERYCPSVTSTRSFSDRLETLENVRQSGMKVCCGGILGMGEHGIGRD